MNVLRVDVPILPLIALRRHRDLAWAAILQIQPFGFQRQLRVLISGQIVVDDGGDRHIIALTEEARNSEPYHQVLAYDHAIDRAADLGVDGHTTYSCSPGGERIRESELSCSPA